MDTKKISLRLITSEIEKLFSHFNKYLFSGKLVTPVITIQAGEDRKANGWFANDIWDIGGKSVHEINISAEILKEKTKNGSPQIAVTLLHEMVHLLNKQSGIEDTSDNGHHTKKFGKAASEHGLEVEYIKRFPGCITRELNSRGLEVFRKFKFREDFIDKNRKSIRYSNLSVPLGTKSPSGTDTESLGDEGNNSQENNQKKRKLRPLQCPSCNYKVQVANGFAHQLKCLTCDSVLEG